MFHVTTDYIYAISYIRDLAIRDYFLADICDGLNINLCNTLLEIIYILEKSL